MIAGWNALADGFRAGLVLAVLLLLLTGCPRFHAEPLPGAPADATFVAVDGVHVRYREAGKGPAVVLIHGFGASSDSWLPVMQGLGAKHRVIAIDLKGFGWSSRPEGDYSPAAQARLVWAVLDKLGVSDVAVVGHSWGTSIALAMATAQPARVRRVALYAAYVYDDQVPGFFRWAEKGGLGEVLFGLYYKERIEERAALAYFDERHITQARIDRVEADLARPGTAAAALAAARAHHFNDLHRALVTTPFGRGFPENQRKPVLLLWGEQDQITPIRFGHRLLAELGDAELKTYARCGHIPMVEAPQSTRDLAAFLAKDAVAPSPTPPAPTATPAVPGPAAGIDRRLDSGAPKLVPATSVRIDGRPDGGVAGHDASTTRVRIDGRLDGGVAEDVASPNRVRIDGRLDGVVAGHTPVRIDGRLDGVVAGHAASSTNRVRIDRRLHGVVAGHATSSTNRVRIDGRPDDVTRDVASTDRVCIDGRPDGAGAGPDTSTNRVRMDGRLDAGVAGDVASINRVGINGRLDDVVAGHAASSTNRVRIDGRLDGNSAGGSGSATAGHPIGQPRIDRRLDGATEGQAASAGRGRMDGRLDGAARRDTSASRGRIDRRLDGAEMEPVDLGGGGADGGAGGGVGGGEASAANQASATTADAGAIAVVEVIPKPHRVFPIGADLATLGAELTPRLYASPRDKMELVVHGALRVRDVQLYNLDLDRGLDSSGQPLAPVPLGGGQRLDALDLRARTDLAFYARGVGVAVKARIDWLDNVALGGDPDLGNGSPATSGGQRPSTVVIKRAWGEALTPFGTLAVGRMGAHFGLGMAANGGDCEDCDHGDASDRAAFVTPIAGHLIAAAYDIASRGPFTTARDGDTQKLSLEPSDRAAGPTLAILKVHSPATLARRADADRTSLEYAAYITRRTQDRDVPASYLPTATGTQTMFTENDLVARGFSTTITGGWLRLTGPRFRVEAELAYARANLEQPSLIPGAEITTPVTSRQLGLAMQSELLLGTTAKLGLDGGYASGDDAPGFGAFPKLGEAAPMPGAFDGAQANPPRDTTVDNFRFHPDFHVDQILFREILGTVTDAIYVRPHARAALLTVGPGRLELGATLIASWAVKPASTPSGERALGIEIDPELRYASKDGFAMTLAYGLFLPGAAFDNTTLEARPAQVFRARVAFVF